MQNIIEPLTMRFRKREVDVFPFWLAILGAGILFGLVGAYQVFAYGLQVTGLSNQVPWGLWITIDLTAIAFGVIVFLLRNKRFETIGKLAVLLGFLGYSTAGMVLLFDLGQPLRFWHPVVFWQPHSLLWEITMCVVLYLSVLLAELLPVVLEHPVFTTHPLLTRFPILKKASDGLNWLAHWLHGFAPALAIIGLTLSLLHQASLVAPKYTPKTFFPHLAQQSREAELTNQLSQTEAELRAAMEGLRDARREAPTRCFQDAGYGSTRARRCSLCFRRWAVALRCYSS